MDVPVRLWHPDHKLHRVEVRIDYFQDGDACVIVRGSTETKRADLWHYTETCPGSKGTLQVPDLCHWAIQAVHADRPTSQPALMRALRGGTSWDQEQLDI